MKIAIFGSNGFLGRNLSYYLNNKGYDIFDYDVQDRTEHKWMKYSSIDIMNIDSLSVLENDYDYLFLFSGKTGTKSSFDKAEKVLEINILGLRNVLEAIKDLKTRIIFPSTRLVYKGSNDSTLIETSLKQPLTPYAISKLTCEKLIYSYNNFFNTQYLIFRIGVPFGNLIDTSFSYGTVGFLKNQIIEHKRIRIFGDGLQKRTFTYIEDLCLIFSKILEDKIPLNETYNIGGFAYSIIELAHLMKNSEEVEITHENWAEDDKKIESGSTIFNSSKLDSLLQDLRYTPIHKVLNLEN